MREYVRALPVDFAVSGRTLEGLALKWNRPYTVSDDGRTFYREGWRPNAFTLSLESAGNVFELRPYHQDVRVGRTAFEQSEEGLVFRAVVEPTPQGDEALSRVLEGRDRGVSIKYGCDQQRRNNRTQIIWRLRGWLRELSLTPSPQYEDAMVTIIRDRATYALIERTRVNLDVNPHWL